jgi:hypothetical protein
MYTTQLNTEIPFGPYLSGIRENEAVLKEMFKIGGTDLSLSNIVTHMNNYLRNTNKQNLNIFKDGELVCVLLLEFSPGTITGGYILPLGDKLFLNDPLFWRTFLTYNGEANLLIVDGFRTQPIMKFMVEKSPQLGVEIVEVQQLEADQTKFFIKLQEE